MKISDITKISILVAFLCVFGPISIPIGPVPITLQTLVLFVISMILPIKQAVLTIILYILIGALGMPVFSNYRGGWAHFIGVTGGYIWAFPLTPVVINYFKKITSNKWIYGIVGSFAAFSVIAVCGMIWMYVWATQLQSPPVAKMSNLTSLLQIGYWPFIGSNIIKAILATVIANQLGYLGYFKPPLSK